jgi:hypothetical protein
MTDEPDKAGKREKKPEPRRPGGNTKRGAAKKAMRKNAKKGGAK